jgi:hypothetical protein
MNFEHQINLFKKYSKAKIVYIAIEKPGLKIIDKLDKEY